MYFRHIQTPVYGMTTRAHGVDALSGRTNYTTLQFDTRKNVTVLRPITPANWWLPDPQTFVEISKEEFEDAVKDTIFNILDEVEKGDCI